MNTKVQRPNKGPLVIVLVILLIVILSLATAILVLHFKKRANKGIILSDDNLAKECIEKRDSRKVIECLDNKSVSYDDDCVNALKVYQDMPVEWFDTNEELADFYTDAYVTSVSCENEELQKYWENEFHKVSDKNLEARD